MKFAATLALALAALTAPAGTAGPVTTAPDIELTSEAGSTIRLLDLKGQVVLLDFWASWCVPCRVSFPAIDALQKELRDKGFRALAVNVDEERRNADNFLATRPHTLTVVFDPKGRAAETFQLQGMPSTVLIDRKGVVRVTHMGYTEKTIVQYRAEILALLEES
jgi:thiol-disulfide isomerase/thioredoxin